MLYYYWHDGAVWQTLRPESSRLDGFQDKVILLNCFTITSMTHLCSNFVQIFETRQTLLQFACKVPKDNLFPGLCVLVLHGVVPPREHSLLIHPICVAIVVHNCERALPTETKSRVERLKAEVEPLST